MPEGFASWVSGRVSQEATASWMLGSHRHPSSLLTTVHIPPTAKGRESCNLFHSAMTVLPLPATSISYKKFIHDLDLQVFIMGGLATVQILTNEIDREQYRQCPMVSQAQ